jgi:cation diffusion facilitator CzcD-associated flavoprotein CzcO
MSRPTLSSCDVAIIGAGPYGLSAAAHLRAESGHDLRVFGEPMSFWQRHMPVGMLLRSPWVACHIADPGRALTLDRYRSQNGADFSQPVPLDRFVDYGLWFQREAVPDTDSRHVDQLERIGDHFELTLEDGERLRARQVVVAAGIVPFAWRPPEVAELPAPLVSHTSEHNDLARFAHRRILVVGGGQSALESAALLHEAGAEVEVVVRAPIVHWLGQHQRLHELGPISALLYAWPDVGPAGVSRLVAAPNIFRRLPRRLQNKMAVRAIRPAASGWLRDRLAHVPMMLGRSVVSAVPAADAVAVRLDDGSERSFDHLMLGTGFRVDISRYGFLSPSLLQSVRRVDGYPRLSRHFESSVPGLFFLGAPAAWSFGPLMRFVAGTRFAAQALTLGIAGQAKRRPRGT